MGTKKANGRVWLYVGEDTRKRLNLYKILLGVQDTNTTNQDATIAALLDKAGAPTIEDAAQLAEAVQP